MTAVSFSPQMARKELYAIIREDLPFGEKAQQALELGRDYLNADYGILTKIDPETDQWEVLVSTEPSNGEIPVGMEADLATTYCRRTFDSDGQVVFHDAEKEGWSDDIAMETYGLHCYVGTTIQVDGDRFGTVCFSADNPRTEAFTDGETMFAELVSTLLERELEKEQHEAQLTRQSNLSLVLSRVLRHNLRNDMIVIRGYTELLAQQAGDQQFSEIVLENIDHLIDLSDKARKLDQIIAADHETVSTDVVKIVQSVVDEVKQEYPAADISIDASPPVNATVLPSFDKAMEELIENAAKHAGDKPTVSISVESVPNAVTIRISDDGPGLSQQETDVLRSGAETPLIHGSGLGLWLTHWIISGHGGTIEASTADDGTTMTVRIPKAQEVDIQSQLSELARAKDQYEAAFEGATDAIVIVNDDALIVDANPAASRIYGMEQQRLLGQPLVRFLPDGFDFESDWDTFQTEGNDRDTTELIGADGESRFVEYSATADIVPGHHVIIGRDVTEQRERQAELERKDRAMDAAPIGITISDPDQEDNPVIYANERFEELTGYSQAEILGRNCRFLQGPDTDPEPIQQMREAINAGEQVQVELRNYRKDGTAFTNRVTISPVWNDDGEVVNYVGFQEEIDTETSVE